MSVLLSSLPSFLQTLFSRHKKLSLASVAGFLIFSMLGMGMISLATLNGKAMHGYMLNELEQERQELVEDGEITEMLSLRARSMEVIESASAHMVKPTQDQITYILPVTVVAQNDSEFKQ